MPHWEGGMDISSSHRSRHSMRCSSTTRDLVSDTGGQLTSVASKHNTDTATTLLRSISTLFYHTEEKMIFASVKNVKLKIRVHRSEEIICDENRFHRSKDFPHGHTDQWHPHPKVLQILNLHSPSARTASRPQSNPPHSGMVNKL